MYSLVIAEDELVTRQGLVNMVKWNELGFRVDGEFSDGREVLEYLKQNTPDVILTDIKMSHVSGLEIARFVSEQNLPIQIVLLSGYKNFDYAQRAVEYGVSHYLVKPFSFPKLREDFSKLREKLDRQNAKQNAMLERVEHYNKLVNYQRQQFVLDAWLGVLDDSQHIEKRLQLLQFKPQLEKQTYIYLVKINLNSEGSYNRFLASYGMQEFQEQILSILGTIDDRLEFYLINWDDAKDEDRFSGVGVFWIKAASATGNVVVDIHQLGKKFQEEIYSLAAVKSDIILLQEMNDPAELVHCGKAFENNENVEEQCNTSIGSVMNYIKEHYNEDITLSEIAKAVYLNPIYVGRLIKEQTGKNYTELLLELRVEKAINLIKNTEMYVYEVAEMVGYRNLKYFYKVFKKVTGKSPNDYRLKKIKK